MKKTCNNGCRTAWCCSGETYLEPKERYADSGYLALGRLKGMEFYESEYPDHIHVHVICPCRHLDDKKFCTIKGNKVRLEVCGKYPTPEHEGIVMTEKCAYFDPLKHIAIEKLKIYKPEVK